MKKTWNITLGSALLLALMMGCDNTRNVVRLDGRTPCRTCTDADYIETSFLAMKYMLGNVRPEIIGDDAFDQTRPIIWASCVDLNNYAETSNFGRLMGESLAIALQNHRKCKLIQMTLRQGSVPITPEGEFLLSRDVRDLASQFNAGAALVSSYSVSPDKVYVQFSLINVDQNVLAGAFQFAIPLGPRTEALLKNVEFPADAIKLREARPTCVTAASRLPARRLN